MNKLLTLLIIATVSFIQMGQAQNGKANFADSYFDAFNFEAAIQNYKYLIDNDKVDQSYIHAKIGDGYRLLNDTKNAELWYARAAIFDSVSTNTIYYFGQMLRANAKYAEAIPVYERYRTMMPDENHITSIIESLKFMVRQEKIDMPEINEVEIAGVNSALSDFSPFVHDDTLYFTSNGYGSNNTQIDVWTNASFLKVYTAPILGYNSFGNVEAIDGKAINAKYHDGPIGFDPTTDELYLTRSNFEGKKYLKYKTNNVKLKLIKLQKDAEGEWEQGEDSEDFPFNNPEYSVGHAAITPDGSTLYFVSDMPHEDAQGGIDLYQCTKVDGFWSELKNLGPNINTKGEERFPFVDDEGILYFSSDGHPGYGGMDLFAGIKDKEGNWRRVKNLGPPMNTNFDDFAYYKQGNEGYFTSNRPSDFGDDNIYSFKEVGMQLYVHVFDKLSGEPLCNSNVEISRNNQVLYNLVSDCNGMVEFVTIEGGDFKATACVSGYKCETEIRDIKDPIEPGSEMTIDIALRNQNDAIAIKVIAVDKETRAPISNATINVFDNETAALFNQVNAQGRVQLSSKISEYKIGAVAIDYYPADSTVLFDDLEVDQEIIIALTPVEKLVVAKESEGLVFYNIYYDFDESYIQVAANVYLQIVLDFMNENNDAIVSIESHTDSRASNKYNVDLSQQRALSAKNWLIARGIDESRLKSEGFGEKQLVNKCADNVECTEEEHQLNRRTEFRIVSGSIDVRSLAPFDVSMK